MLKPKDKGGASIKSAREMNWALLVKLSWRIMNGVGEIWSEVMRAKYGVKEDDGAHFRERERVSQIWRGAVWRAELSRKGFVWDVRNEERTRFWKDIWLGSKPLIEEGVNVVRLEQEDLKVA